MGTGVGEAMLIGAAVGGTVGAGASAIQGRDPFTGALMGAGLGALGGGVSGAFSGAAGGAGAGTGAGAAGGAGGAGAAALPAAGSALTPATQAILSGTPAASGSFGALSAAPASGSFGSLSAAAPGISGAFTAPASAIPMSTAGLTAVPGYVPGMYASGAAAMPGGAASSGFLSGSTMGIPNSALATGAGGLGLAALMMNERNKFGIPSQGAYESSFDMSQFNPSDPMFAPGSVYEPSYRDYRTAAEGGIMKLANGGPVERMTQMNTAINPQGGLYPQGMIDKTQYATPTQRPTSMELLDTEPAYQKSNPMLMARGGIADLGSYSDGGRMLKGPGDGMSDSIPGVIAGKQPARLADGEFVVPADVVSHLGNGSTDAGAKQLYSMMDKVRKARTGKKAQGKQINPRKYMPA